jgi:hypothetical protein
LANIKAAVEEGRAKKSPHNLAIAGGYAAAATVELIRVLLGLVYGTNFVVRLVVKSKGTSIRPIRIGSMEIVTEHRIANMALWLIEMIRVFSILLVLYFYLPLVLSLFPWTANLAPKLLSFVLVPQRQVAHVLLDFIPNLFFIFIIIMVSRYILGFIKIFFINGVTIPAVKRGSTYTSPKFRVEIVSQDGSNV